MSIVNISTGDGCLPVIVTDPKAKNGKVFEINTKDFYIDTLGPLQSIFRFLLGESFEDEFLVGPTTETRDISITTSDGITYTVSFYPDRNIVFSEAISKGGKIILYRDRLDQVPIIKKEVSTKEGNSLIDILSLDYKEVKSRVNELYFLRYSSLGKEVYREISSTTMIDFDGYRPEYVQYAILDNDFADSEMEMVNNIICSMFNDISEVYKNGNYLVVGKEGPGVVFPRGCGGGGYRHMIDLIKLWLRVVVNDEGTLILCNWKNHLHFKLVEYLKTLLMTTETKGTLFLIDSSDED